MTQLEKENLKRMLLGSQEDFELASSIIKNVLVYKENPQELYNILCEAMMGIVTNIHRKGPDTKRHKQLTSLTQSICSRFNLKFKHRTIW